MKKGIVYQKIVSWDYILFTRSILTTWRIFIDLAFASEFMPMIDEESYGTFCSTWEIKNWSTLSKESPVRGPKFKTDEHEW